LEERGSFIAEDCLFVGTQQLWSPGANIHRTPFSGRNFEYYSEDSIMSYLMGAAQTAGMQEKGLNAAIKHFCANDQETNRSGLCVFMSEQGYRQGPLKGFEGAFTKGGALGTMMSFSRIGCVRMYQDAATLTQVLRNEWGFEGVTITDSVKGETGVSTVASLASGTDTFNADPGRSSEVLKYLVANKDGYILQCLRQANKRFYYAMANSNLMNGLTRDMVISDFVPWWHKALYALDIVIGVLTVACAGLFIYHAFGKRRKEKD
jgi:beta-glucosidase